MTDRIDLAKAAHAIGGRFVPGKGSVARGVATDSRKKMQGRLFVALVGDTFDGHRFIGAAFEQGASAALIADPSLLLAHPTQSFILVDDTLRGLQDLAGWRRRSMRKLTVVAVTGSNGKTTVKEMIGGILATKGKTLVTQGNLNNHVGLPLTLLGLKGDERFAVVEMGMNHAGEIARLCQIALPDIGVITNVGAAHLGHFKNIAAIADAKGELIEGLGPKGIALLNGGDKGTTRLLARFEKRAQLKTFGRNGDADWSLVDSWSDRKKTGRHCIVAEGEKEAELFIPLIGAHQADNATAAYAVGRLLGVTPAAIAKALAKVKPAPMRMEAGKLPNGAVIVNDAYNANPDSMEAALRAVADEPGEGAFFMMGEMKELGTTSAAAHATVGRLAARLGYQMLVAVGDACAPAVEAARKGKIEAHLAPTHEKAAALLARRLRPRSRLLVKGSRGATMERGIEALVRRMEKR